MGRTSWNAARENIMQCANLCVQKLELLFFQRNISWYHCFFFYSSTYQYFWGSGPNGSSGFCFCAGSSSLWRAATQIAKNWKYCSVCEYFTIKVNHGATSVTSHTHTHTGSLIQCALQKMGRGFEQIGHNWITIGPIIIKLCRLWEGPLKQSEHDP